VVPVDSDSLARVSVGLEEGADGELVAHPLALAGCAASGASPRAAVGAFEREWMEWLRFLASAGEPVPPPGAELEIAVDEWVRTDARTGVGESAALFAADLRPLSDDEIRRSLRLLGDLRGRLLARVRRLRPAELEEELERPSEGGWTVRRVLEELARAQWWTLSRLGATPLAGAPDRTVARLDTALALVVQHLGHLEPDRRGLRLELDGEEWTPRKVLRRLLWLEWTLGRAAIRALDATPTSA
jgi:predicted RNase H-like HicB family nuclease